ncbi:M56 family metallopeptidase [bacterium]|nr:M56 family metallopeptidase [bacterium]
MQEFMVCVLSNILVASVMACGILLLGRVWRNPPVFHALWFLVLLKLVTPAIQTFPCLPAIDFGSESTIEESTSPVAIDSPSPINELTSSPTISRATPIEKTMVSPRRSSSLPSKPTPEKPAVQASRLAETLPDTIKRPKQESVAFNDLPPPPHHKLKPKSESQHSTAGEPAQEQRATNYSWSTWALAISLFIWIGGSVFTLCKDIFVWHRFQRIISSHTPNQNTISAATENEVKSVANLMGFSRSPRVLIVDTIMSPMIWPTVQGPILILPKTLIDNLSTAQIRTLAAHELAHLKSRHHWFRWFERGVRALYWWLPLIRVVSFQLRQFEEEVCDAWVVQLLPDNAESYAHLLIDTAAFLEQSPHQPHATSLGLGMNHFESLKRRITMVMQQKTKPQISIVGWAAFLVLLGLGLPFSPTFAAQEVPSTAPSTVNDNIAIPDSTNRPAHSKLEKSETGSLTEEELNDLNFDGIASTQMSMVAMELDHLQDALNVEIDVMQISFDMEETINQTTRQMFSKFPSAAGNPMLGISLESGLKEHLWQTAKEKVGDNPGLEKYLSDVADFHRREDQLGQDFFMAFLNSHLCLSDSQEKEIEQQIASHWNSCLNLIFYFPDFKICAGITHDLLDAKKVEGILSPKQWEAYQDLARYTFSQKQMIDLLLGKQMPTFTLLEKTCSQLLQLRIDELKKLCQLTPGQVEQLFVAGQEAAARLSKSWQATAEKYTGQSNAWELERELTPEDHERTFTPLLKQIAQQAFWNNALANTLDQEQMQLASERQSEKRAEENWQFSAMFLYFLNQNRTLGIEQLTIVTDVIDAKTSVEIGSCTNLNRIHALILSLPEEVWKSASPRERWSVDWPKLQQWMTEIKDRQPDE